MSGDGGTEVDDCLLVVVGVTIGVAQAILAGLFDGVDLVEETLPVGTLEAFGRFNNRLCGDILAGDGPRDVMEDGAWATLFERVELIGEALPPAITVRASTIRVDEETCGATVTSAGDETNDAMDGALAALSKCGDVVVDTESSVDPGEVDTEVLLMDDGADGI